MRRYNNSTYPKTLQQNLLYLKVNNKRLINKGITTLLPKDCQAVQGIIHLITNACPQYFFYWTEHVLRVVFRFCFNACALIQSFSGRFIFLHLSTLQRSDFPGSHGAKKHYRLVLFWARALRSFYFSMFSRVFFQGVWKPCNAGPKRLQTELTNITRQHFCSLPVFLYWRFLYLLSLVGIFLRYLLVLTYFDSSRRHTHATTHATGTQIVRAKMTSLEMTFCRGNKSSSRSPLSCRRKHKKSTARASHSWKTMSSTCRQV